MTTTGTRSDSELLRAFARDGDETAFETLAARHVDLIFAVGLRRSGNRQLAEEATQNVLIGLAAKARKLAVRESNLAGWLHKSTGFEVSKLQRRESRLKKREQAYASETMKTIDDSADETLQRLYPVLDEAIDQLRASDREVIVRRYLHGENFRRIGEALGISEDAAQKRTGRAFERLNQFFRRKAGVTVSSTALLAGLGRQAAEAAPAACLQIAGKTAPAGFLSFFTHTAITMTTSKIITIAAAAVIAGGAISYLVNRDDPPAEAASSSLPTSSPDDLPVVTPDAGNTDNRAVAARTRPTAEEEAKWAAISPHPDKEEFTRRLSVKHDRLLEELTEELALSAAQKGSLRELLDGRLKDFRAALERGPQPDDTELESFRKEGEVLAEAGGIIRGTGLREGLAAFLTDAQLAAFDEREAGERQRQTESHAYTELAALSPALGLTEEQKDRAFDLLQESSARLLEADGDSRAFLALQKGELPAQMELTHPVEMALIAETFGDPTSPKPGSPEFEQRAIELVGKHIDEQVELLAPVLDDQQQMRYRDHLIDRSILGDFGIELPTNERK